MTVLHRGVEREAVQRECQQRGVTDQVAEPGAGEARRTLHVEASDLGVLPRLGERRRVAHPAELLGIFFREPVGSGVVGRVRHLCERCVSCSLRLCKLVLDLLQLLLDAAQLLELLGCRLALDLGA